MPEIDTPSVRPTRTRLEQRIRERRQTFEEFAEYAESFARDHGEPGTLSVRHLQRLAAGRRPNGRPLGRLRPATARLLERVFGEDIQALLAPPSNMDTVVSAPTAQVLRVAIAIVVKRSQVLVVCRRPEHGGQLSWQFPAGVIKPEQSPEDVAVAETLAETGVHCLVARRLGSRLHPITHVQCEYLLCDYLAGEPTNVDVAENSAVTWVAARSIAKLIPVERIYPPVLESIEAASNTMLEQTLAT